MSRVNVDTITKATISNNAKFKFGAFCFDGVSSVFGSTMVLSQKCASHLF